MDCSCSLYLRVVLRAFFTGGTGYCQGCRPRDIGWTDVYLAPDHRAGPSG